MSKPMLLAAIGVGYVLGARAGRERYDALVSQAQALWRDPRVQDKAGKARHVVEEKLPGQTTPPAGAATPPTGAATPPTGGPS